MASGISGVLLVAKGEIKRIKLCDVKSNIPLTMDSLQSIIKKKSPISLLHTLPLSEFTLTFFGYTSGKKGTENKHELPPPMDDTQYFSDILVIACKKDSTWINPINFTPDQYENVYESIFTAGDEKSQNSDESDSESESEEEKLDEDEHTMTSKKKAAEDDGVPEDEDDGTESEQEDEDEEEEDEEEVQDTNEGGEYEDEPVPVKARKPSKKKIIKQNLTVTQNTGRARQQALLCKPGFQEIQQTTPISDQSGVEQKFRQHVLQIIRTKFGSIFPHVQQIKIEHMILTSALADAKTKFVVKHFENSLFQVCYMNAARRLISNLDPSSYVKNSSLLEKINQGVITLDEIATMRVLDYCPELYADLRNRMALREKHLLEGNKAMATDMFKCGQCHKRETTYYELQTRSADEPMTKFINCLNCGNRWRQ